MYSASQVGWVCQALVSIGMPYSPSIFYTSNGMGKAFFWIFALFPWNPLTKGVLDMSAAAENTIQHGECQLTWKQSNKTDNRDNSMYKVARTTFDIGYCLRFKSLYEHMPPVETSCH